MTATLKEVYYLPIHNFHIAHNTPCLSSKRLPKHCSNISRVFTVVPKEYENIAYTICFCGGGVNKVYLYFGEQRAESFGERNSRRWTQRNNFNVHVIY